VSKGVFRFLSGGDRLDQIRRHEDDKLGLVGLIGRAPEQRADDGNRPQPENLVLVTGRTGLQQAGNAEALAVPQLDRGSRPPDRQGRIVVPATVTAFVKSSSLTSGMSFKLMTPRVRTAA
jgi:hypothetical protein